MLHFDITYSWCHFSGTHEPLRDPKIQLPTYSRQTSSTDSQISKELEPLKSYYFSLSEPRSWEDAISEYRTENAVLDTSENSRRESTGSRSLSDWNCSDTTRSDERISPGTCSVSVNSMFKVGLVSSALLKQNILTENSDLKCWHSFYMLAINTQIYFKFFRYNQLWCILKYHYSMVKV